MGERIWTTELLAHNQDVVGTFLCCKLNRGFNIPKVSTESAAAGIFDKLEKGEEEIFPDPASQSIAESWRAGVSKTLERQFAAFAP